MNAEPGRIRGLVAAVPADKMNDIFAELLRYVKWSRFRSVLAPLINDIRLTRALADVTQVLQPSTAAALLNATTPEKISILLRAPSNALATLVSQIHSDKILKMVLPLMDEPETLLENKVLPLLEGVEHPDRKAAVVNQTEPDILFWLLQGSEPQPLVAVLNSCTPEDFEPDGAVTRLLQELADHRGLVKKKVIPLIDAAEPEKMAQMIRGVKTEKMLEVLQRIPLEDLVDLLAHMNAELVVRLLNGPLESTATAIAGVTAGALRNPQTAQTFTQLADNLTRQLQQADKLVEDVQAHKERVAAQVMPVMDDVKAQASKVIVLVDDVKAQADKVVDDVKAQADKVVDDMKATRDKVIEDVNKNRRRGQQERGAVEEDDYKFGDVTRGFFAHQVEEVKSTTRLGAQVRGSETDEYKFGDFTRGLVEKARGSLREMSDKPLFPSVALAANASACRANPVLNTCSMADRQLAVTEQRTVSNEELEFSEQTPPADA
jgi:hypothetical protein